MQTRIPVYTTGTIRIDLVGSVWVVTGVGTQFLAPDGVAGWSIAEGDIITCDGAFGIVGLVTLATELALDVWTGITVAPGAAYKIVRFEGLSATGFAGMVQKLTDLNAGPEGPAGPTGPAGTTSTFRNKIINGGFNVNQRIYVSSATLVATKYGHDMWKAGVVDAVYSFFSDGPYFQVTIASGTLTQVVEASQIEGGDYVLSWLGTATAKVNGGSALASPIALTALPANTNVTIEFQPGTARRVQLELGTAATVFESRPRTIEQILCQRYYQRGKIHDAGGCIGSGVQQGMKVMLPTQMRGVPTLAVLTDTSSGPIGTPALQNDGVDAVGAFATSTAFGAYVINVAFEASSTL